MYMFGVSNNMGLSDVYGFIDPEPTHEGNKFDDIQAYVTPMLWTRYNNEFCFEFRHHW